MKPHADFECLPCGQALGDPVTMPVVHEDLPVDCKFCPSCGASEGFTKIFTANFMSGHTRKTGQVITEALRPLYDKDAKQKQGASDFARAGQEALEKTYEKASPAERAQLPTTFQPHIAPAGQVFGNIERAAKMDTRECVTPMVKRNVRPQYAR